jgi:lipoprotein-anchoring transpeptidase ErfK/SrfK
MRHRRKYRLPGRRHSSWFGFRWLLALFIGAIIGETWWFRSHTSEGVLPSHQPALSASLTNSPRVVIIVPHPPAPSRTPVEQLFSAAAGYPRPVRTILEAQVVLEGQNISAGSIDGQPGPQTQAALRAFQQKVKLPADGELNPATKAQLLLASPPLGYYTVTSNDLARLQPLSKSWLAKSRQKVLDFETVLELVAEKSHSHPNLIRSLNPEVNWTNVVAGTVLQIPNVVCADPTNKAAFVTISLARKILEAFDAQTNLLVHFPCSIAQRVEKRPVGELQVAAIAPNPNYTLDPDVFPESPEVRQLKTKLLLPPGPNDPVGTVWIGLNRPGYGIHGTPNPEQVGRTESHGCFRLANWNVERLLKFVWIGMPVYVEP